MRCFLSGTTDHKTRAFRRRLVGWPGWPSGPSQAEACATSETLATGSTPSASTGLGGGTGGILRRLVAGWPFMAAEAFELSGS